MKYKPKSMDSPRKINDSDTLRVHHLSFGKYEAFHKMSYSSHILVDKV